MMNKDDKKVFFALGALALAGLTLVAMFFAPDNIEDVLSKVFKWVLIIAALILYFTSCVILIREISTDSFKSEKKGWLFSIIVAVTIHVFIAALCYPSIKASFEGEKVEEVFYQDRISEN